MMDYVYAKYLREQKTRFLCIVEINGDEEECYVPASCKLSRFIDLTDRDVILRPVAKSNARTRYALYAVKMNRSYVLLDLMAANRMIEDQISRRYFSFLGKRKRILHEHTVNNYKTDLFIEDTDTLIEIKTLLSFDEEGLFPSMYTRRAIEQLRKIVEIMGAGYRVCYLIVALNPRVKRICLDRKQEEYCRLFAQCLEQGMICKGLAVKMNRLRPEICKTIEIRV